MSTLTHKRKHAYRLGFLAEYACMMMLWLKGYRTVAHRWRHAVGEIDIIAERFGTLVLVEVKARNTLEDGMEAVTSRARQRIARAASAFIAAHAEYAGHTVRFDLMVCAAWRLPHHVEDAWRT